MVTSHVPTWEVTESAGYETSWIELGDRTLRARGRAVGTAPQPYWISYELETGEDFVTSRLWVSAETSAGPRDLDLRRDDGDRWTANGKHLPGVDGALDCDLGLCPLTNTMPVLRHGLHLAPGERGALVRYAAGDYRSDVEFDPDGLVVDYPGMARRLGGRRSAL